MATVLSADAAHLTEAQRQRYQEDGFLVVRGVFSGAEMAMVSMDAERLRERKDLIDTNNIRCRWQMHVESDECLFDAFDPVVDLSMMCAELARDPRLVTLVSELYGEPAQLFKDKLIYKPPGARGYDLHQDYIAWDSFPKTFVTAAVAIDPCSRDNGTTEVFAGYHKAGYLSPADGDYHPLPVESVDESRRVFLELEPGDVAIFSGYTPHRSGPNRSDGWRRLLYLSYNAVSDGGDARAAHYREFHTWLPIQYAKYGKHDTYFR
ncbi:MAG TPA: phytanoyl-CoA dioxygenase family protein [Gemmataceae bacterium]|jgi:ectoine hydroxylase-related dioxygenase (phytanoyl-CoA dioxygenase family)|nr:phytanoyl-CoA dioxygenase family protein [Gemmataceae bacterium]